MAAFVLKVTENTCETLLKVMNAQRSCLEDFFKVKYKRLTSNRSACDINSKIKLRGAGEKALWRYLAY